MGQEYAFERSRFNGSIAPNPAVRGTEIGRQGSTQSGPCRTNFVRLLFQPFARSRTNGFRTQ